MCERLLTVVSLQQVGERERRGGKAQGSSNKMQVVSGKLHSGMMRLETSNSQLHHNCDSLFTSHVSRLTPHLSRFTHFKWLRIKHVDENPGASRSVRFSHNMLDVLFHRLFSDFKCIGNLLICPSLCKVFDDCLLAVGQIKSITRMFGIQVLLPPDLLHGDDESGVLNATAVWKAESSEQNGLIRVSGHTFQLELFPVLCFCPDV